MVQPAPQQAPDRRQEYAAWKLRHFGTSVQSS
jgi:hypothetical protein